jgi:hypothetical protein
VDVKNERVTQIGTMVIVVAKNTRGGGEVAMANFVL